MTVIVGPRRCSNTHMFRALQARDGALLSRLTRVYFLKAHDAIPRCGTTSNPHPAGSARSVAPRQTAPPGSVVPHRFVPLTDA
jgi:hypothetical protein